MRKSKFPTPEELNQLTASGKSEPETLKPPVAESSQLTKQDVTESKQQMRRLTKHQSFLMNASAFGFKSQKTTASVET